MSIKRNQEQKCVAVFAGGCFWCTEAVFDSLKGVISAVPGYSGGNVANPTYEQVCAGDTGHLEAVKIEYDPNVISYDDLLAVFFYTHDPTTKDRQGNDVGVQYNSAIFYSDAEQKEKAESLIAELNGKGGKPAYDSPVLTKVLPFLNFYEAEDYHRRYYANHKNAPYCALVIEPKMEKLQSRFKSLLK